MHSLRAAARFSNLFLLAIAALAGLGLAGLRQRHADWRWILAAAVAGVALVNIEALRACSRESVTHEAINRDAVLFRHQAQRRRSINGCAPLFHAARAMDDGMRDP